MPLAGIMAADGAAGIMGWERGRDHHAHHSMYSAQILRAPEYPSYACLPTPTMLYSFQPQSYSLLGGCTMSCISVNMNFPCLLRQLHHLILLGRQRLCFTLLSPQPSTPEEQPMINKPPT